MLRWPLRPWTGHLPRHSEDKHGPPPPLRSPRDPHRARLKLPVRKKPHDFTTIAPGIALAYHRNQGAGTWVVRVADGHGGNWTKGLAVADDYENADGSNVLTFWEAQDRARALARGSVDAGRPCTVTAANLKARGGHPRQCRADSLPPATHARQQDRVAIDLARAAAVA